MYNSITVTNSIDCVNRNIVYKFTLLFDKQNWKTIATLKVHNKSIVSVQTGEMFLDIVKKISNIFNLPHDPNNKVYDGPELKIILDDHHFNNIEWSNVTNLQCDNAFKIPNVYVEKSNQVQYDNVVDILVVLSTIIFKEQMHNLYVS